MAPPSPSTVLSPECPSEEELAGLIEGRAPESTADRILGHLDRCSQCRRLVARSIRALDDREQHGPWAPPGTPRTLRAGLIIAGRYRVDRFLAQGGMGEVYAAQDLELGETVALKTIACTNLDQSRLAARLRAEVHLARRVTHPNVCRILEFGVHREHSRDQDDALPFFTMELLHGQTLAEYLGARIRLAASEAVPLARQMLDGLSAIHEAGIIHRDLKLENVFLESKPSGEVRAVLMDFGLARFDEAHGRTIGSSSGSALGTPAYMAPEQALGGPPSTAWDIYAFGVMLFRMLSGRLPFQEQTPAALALARVRAPAPRLSSFAPGANPALEALVARCLQRDPARRFASVEALRSALEAVGRPVPARQTRQRALVFLPLVVLGVGGSWFVLSRPGRGEAAAPRAAIQATIARGRSGAEAPSASLAVPSSAPAGSHQRGVSAPGQHWEHLHRRPLAGLPPAAAASSGQAGQGRRGRASGPAVAATGDSNRRFDESGHTSGVPSIPSVEAGHVPRDDDLVIPSFVGSVASFVDSAASSVDSPASSEDNPASSSSPVPVTADRKDAHPR